MTVIRQLHNQLVGGLQATYCSGKSYRKVSALYPNEKARHLPALSALLNAQKRSYQPAILMNLKYPESWALQLLQKRAFSLYLISKAPNNLVFKLLVYVYT